MKPLPADQWDELEGQLQCLKLRGIISDIFMGGEAGIWLTPSDCNLLREWLLQRLQTKN